ncbi:MAG: phosphate ABC transporter, permease protein PstA [Phototrophicales bacterium]|nr:MAG: phosphate ABC transporter, permease protein PstA [Phototrophicales bacterium]
MRYLLRENLNKVDLEALAIDLVAQPFIVRTWTLDVLIQRELFGSDEVDEQLQALNAARAEEAAQNNTTWNDAELEYRSWINFNFVRRTLNADAELTGMRNAILGTLWVIAVTIIFAFPVGIGAAIYLEEYAGNNPIKRLIQTNIDNLAGVPSIIYGLLGVALFVRALEPITSGTALGLSNPITANGRTVLSAGLTMGLLILPIIIINAQEAIRAVQPSIRQASYGLGATKWQTIWNHVLPYAMPGILTGTILATSRAIGETAPLLVVGGITFITTDPTGPFSKFTALPLQIYFWTSQPRDADKAVAAATIVILLAILISLNSFAIILRNRFEKQVRGR